MLGTPENDLCIPKEQDVLMSRSLPCLSVLSLWGFFSPFFPFAKKCLNLFVTVKQTSLCQRGFSLEKPHDWLLWQ